MFYKNKNEGVKSARQTIMSTGGSGMALIMPYLFCWIKWHSNIFRVTSQNSFRVMIMMNGLFLHYIYMDTLKVLIK